MKSASTKGAKKSENTERTTQAVKEAAKKKQVQKKAEPRKKTSKNISFSLDEAIEIANKSEQTGKTQKTQNGTAASKPASAASSNGKRKVVDEKEVKSDNSMHGAASIADILGYNPDSGDAPPTEETEIPKKYMRYYKLLVELRDHVTEELDLHTKDTLQRSSKDDSGDLSSYSQHMADAGTDTFDRDFALSLVSTEQEALYEIEEAIQRIKSGTYGVCELTGKPIKKERLLAVPFARFSVEGQAEYERTHRRSAQRGGAFAESGEETVKFLEEEGDE